MTEPSRAKTLQLKTKDRIIVALDVETADAARSIVDELRAEVGAFKIGLQLFTAAGPAIVREMASSGLKIFLDLKFHDIPNTVAAASTEAARLGVWMFNVHTSGGREMMSRARESVHETCTREGIATPLVIGVTVLTSSNQETLRRLGITSTIEEHVLNLTRDAAESGLDGVVASAIEAAAIRGAVNNNDFVIVTPGIRPISATQDDQRRVTTPAEALAAGSDFLVIGRPITASSNRTDAVREIIASIDQTAK
jgi:orotidine-5'-phosphate decarboxylase